MNPPSGPTASVTPPSTCCGHGFDASVCATRASVPADISGSSSSTKGRKRGRSNSSGSSVSRACSSPRTSCSRSDSGRTAVLFQKLFSTRRQFKSTIRLTPMAVAASSTRLSTSGRGSARIRVTGSGGGGSSCSLTSISRSSGPIPVTTPVPMRSPSRPTQSSSPTAARCTSSTCRNLRPPRRTRSPPPAGAAAGREQKSSGSSRIRFIAEPRRSRRRRGRSQTLELGRALVHERPHPFLEIGAVEALQHQPHRLFLGVFQ